MTVAATPARRWAARPAIRGRHLAGRPRRVRTSDLLTMAVGLLIVYLIWPASYGGRLSSVIVAGESMSPTLDLGDLVVTWRAGEPRVGDIVLYTVPDGPAAGQPVIHRIVGGGPDGWVTQGDNVAQPDRWRPTHSDILGRQVVHVPAGGRGLWFLRSPLAVAALAGLAVMLWVWPEREHRRGRHLPD